MNEQHQPAPIPFRDLLLSIARSARPIIQGFAA